MDTSEDIGVKMLWSEAAATCAGTGSVCVCVCVCVCVVSLRLSVSLRKEGLSVVGRFVMSFQ